MPGGRRRTRRRPRSRLPAPRATTSSPPPRSSREELTRMSASKTHGHAAKSGHDAAHGHHELPFWRKYIFSVDHKVIGVQYGVTALVFLCFGFTLMMLLRWPLPYPGQPLPVVGKLLGENAMPGGVMAPEFYNQLGAMHGTIMVFLGVVPLAVGGFGNFVVHLQIGAPDMAFPRLNMVSYWVFLPGCI